MTAIVLRDVEMAPGARVDVRIECGRIVEIGEDVTRHLGEREVVGRGGALLPGLHDHHIHLLATAASLRSVSCGPPAVTTANQLSRTLWASTPMADGWVRGVGYHECVAGELDRFALDAIGPEAPVRIQHRSGGLWILNSAGLAAIDATSGPQPPGLERDAEGTPTGRIFRGDRWLRDRLGPSTIPDLGALGMTLLRAGVTGVTDATPDLDRETRNVLVEATSDGRLPQRLCMLGVDTIPESTLRGHVLVGPRKIVLADHALPDLPTLRQHIRELRGTRPESLRPVAVHCVSRVALVLLLAALDDVGSVPGDRVEHAAVVPSALLSALRRHGVTVVTQPGLLAERGDEYLSDVDPEDVSGLYRVASLRRCGVPVALSSDAPYAAVDPWATVRAAVARTTPAGIVIGESERVEARTALEMLASPLMRPDASTRVERSVPADLVLAHVPWEDLLADPDREFVRAVVIDGNLVLV